MNAETEMNTADGLGADPVDLKAQREGESLADYDERRADENEEDVERYRTALESIAAMVPTEDEWRSAADFMEATADIVACAGIVAPAHYED